jgi:hypothetical protein
LEKVVDIDEAFSAANAAALDMGQFFDEADGAWDDSPVAIGRVEESGAAFPFCQSAFEVGGKGVNVVVDQNLLHEPVAGMKLFRDSFQGESLAVEAEDVVFSLPEVLLFAVDDFRV